MKKLYMVILGLVMGLALSSCGNSHNSAVERIKERGYLLVGTEGVTEKFNLQNIANGGEFEGLEIDMARLLAKDILGDENAVQFKILSASDRAPMVDKGEVDLILSMFTITTERLKSVDFSRPYFIEGLGIMVRKDSEISELSELSDKVMGVLQSTTTRKQLEDVLEQSGFNLSFSEFSSYPDMKVALIAKRIDAFATDRTTLQSYVDGDTEILKSNYGSESFGIAVKKGSDLLPLVNDSLTQWCSDGVMDELLKKHNLPPVDWAEVDLLINEFWGDK